MSVMPKVVNGFSWTFVCKMGAGPSTNLYSIGGDPLTQLNFFNYIFWNFCPLQNKRWQWENERTIFYWWPTDPLMQSIEHFSLSTALVNRLCYCRCFQSCPSACWGSWPAQPPSECGSGTTRAGCEQRDSRETARSVCCRTQRCGSVPHLQLPWGPWHIGGMPPPPPFPSTSYCTSHHTATYRSHNEFAAICPAFVQSVWSAVDGQIVWSL